MVRASIVIATYNKAEYLKRTLMSIFSQDVPFEYEVIVVDDGSTDNTKEVCKNVRYYYHNNSRYRNPGPARNIGYRIAKGDVIIQQSDEVEHKTPDTIQLLVERLEPKSCVFGKVIDVDTKGRKVRTYCSEKLQRPLFFLGSLWKSDLFAVGGNDEDFTEPSCEDTWLGQCLKHRGLKFIFCDDILGWHHHHPRPRNSRSPISGALYWHKKKEAELGRHPWTARTGAWLES